MQSPITNIDGISLKPRNVQINNVQANGPLPRLKKRRKFPLSYLWGIRCLTLAVCLYILIGPFLPGLAFKPYPEPGLLKQSSNNGTVARETNSEHRLTVPKIGVDALVLEGKDSSTLDKGIWHIPNSRSPGEKGNTVLTAHRFKYLSGKNTFYNLDKLAKGDTIQVKWDGYTYNYEVMDVRIVQPSDTSVEDDTTEPTLTLYTCTPLWTSKSRLVVVARLASVL